MNVFVEKYKKWNYFDDYGRYIWTNKYGDIIKIANSKGEKLSINTSEEELELTRRLADEIAREIDREIINNIVNGNF